MLFRRLAVLLAAVVLQACFLDRSEITSAPGDGGGTLDAGRPVDARPVDAGPVDAGPLDAGPLDAGPLDAGPLDAGPLDAGPLDAGPLDAGPLDAGPLDAGPLDAGPSDAGPPDAGPCPFGRTGTMDCPFTQLSDLAGVPAGRYVFDLGGLIESEVDDAGWLLVASADASVTSGVLDPISSGDLTFQSHRILGEAAITALPDIEEVRIDSSAGSNVEASATSTDSFVLDQLRRYRSLHSRVFGGEEGSVRWNGDASRMTSTCRNANQDALNRFVFQTCGADGDNLHWRPERSGAQWNRWVWDSGEPRDRLNLWVRALP